MYNIHGRGNSPIPAQLVAEKLSAVRNYESPLVQKEIEANPRFVEVLWFLQWVSSYRNFAGGIERFVDELLSECGHLLGSEPMFKFGTCRHYTAAQIEQIRHSIPFDKWPEEGEKTFSGSAGFIEWCREEAQKNLADYLFRLCEDPRVMFTRPAKEFFIPGVSFENIAAPWYFPRIAEAIMAFMDRREKVVAAQIGETSITALIFKWLEITIRTKDPVKLTGNTRFGKTEAIANWCLRKPGLARVVETPESTSLLDLLLAAENALGIIPERSETASARRERIDSVLAQFDGILVFDEAQFLLPLNYTKNTVPHRMNWIRRRVMDRHIACTMIATPQGYTSARDKFVKKTGYAVAQFDERILEIKLPDEVEKDDLLSIARVQFPKLPQQYLEYVVSNTLATERNFMSDIAKIAKLSRVQAEQAGRKLQSLEDIKIAIASVLPSAETTQPSTPTHARVPTAKARKTAPAAHKMEATSDALEITPGRALGARISLSIQDRITTPAELLG